MPKVITGWKCPFTDQVYTPDKLIGQGSPPASPNTPHGMGRINMVPVIQERKEPAADQPVIGQ